MTSPEERLLEDVAKVESAHLIYDKLSFATERLKTESSSLGRLILREECDVLLDAVNDLELGPILGIIRHENG